MSLLWSFRKVMFWDEGEFFKYLFKIVSGERTTACATHEKIE